MMQRFSRFRAIAITLLTATFVANTGCSTAPVVIPPWEGSGLANAMLRRLAIADQVAWVKYQSGAPVLDAARELQVLAQAVSAATEAGVDPESASRFFAAQIVASRIRRRRGMRWLLPCARRDTQIPWFAQLPSFRDCWGTVGFSTCAGGGVGRTGIKRSPTTGRRSLESCEVAGASISTKFAP